jgi:hypothetical protein
MEARGSRGGICVVLVAALALAGCGGSKAAKGLDLTAIRCPAAASGKPAPDSFDTAELIGLELADARAKAADHGCDVVVAKKDGAGVAVPIDVDPKLIYVYTERGVVSEIEGVGGGI